MPAGNAHEHGGGPRMQAEPIDDRDFLLDLLAAPGVAPATQQPHYLSLGSIILRSFVLNSSALLRPRPFSFWSIAATSTKRAMSRPGRTGIVTCGTCSRGFQ